MGQTHWNAKPKYCLDSYVTTGGAARQENEAALVQGVEGAFPEYLGGLCNSFFFNVNTS